jgi:hypothetical protein
VQAVLTSEAPSTQWVADMTALETAEGELYLAAIVDIYWVMEKSLPGVSSAKSREVLGKGGPGVLPWRGLGCPQFLFLFPKEVC